MVYHSFLLIQGSGVISGVKSIWKLGSVVPNTYQIENLVISFSSMVLNIPQRGSYAVQYTSITATTGMKACIYSFYSTYSTICSSNALISKVYSRSRMDLLLKVLKVHSLYFVSCSLY